MFGTRIYVPETTEGSALGAAVMAWAALGMVPDILVAKEMMKAKTYREANPLRHASYEEQGKRAENVLEVLKSIRPGGSYE